jgi:hypothetical protein
MLMGLDWRNLMDKMRREAQEATLEARVTGSQEEVRAGVHAYIKPFSRLSARRPQRRRASASWCRA